MAQENKKTQEPRLEMNTNLDGLNEFPAAALGFTEVISEVVSRVRNAFRSGSGPSDAPKPKS